MCRAGQWYTGYVEHLFEHNITTGCTATKYCPNDYATRAHMAKFIAVAWGLD